MWSIKFIGERERANLVIRLAGFFGIYIARQSGFTVYRPRPHAIPGNCENFHFSLFFPRSIIIHCTMASFASVHVSAANKTIVPWSMISLNASQKFGGLFGSVQAGKYAIIKT